MLFVVSVKKLKNLIHHTFSKKALAVSVVCSKCKNKHEIIFKKEKSIEILKYLGLIENISLL